MLETIAWSSFITVFVLLMIVPNSSFLFVCLVTTANLPSASAARALLTSLIGLVKEIAICTEMNAVITSSTNPTITTISAADLVSAVTTFVSVAATTTKPVLGDFLKETTA